MERRGLEQAASSCKNTVFSGQGGAGSGPVGAENGPIDPDLASVIEAWDSLPTALRAAILAMIDAADTTAAD